MFVKRDSEGEIVLMLSKITDELLFVGTMNEVRYVVKKISEPFTIIKIFLDKKNPFQRLYHRPVHDYGNI